MRNADVQIRLTRIKTPDVHVDVTADFQLESLAAAGERPTEFLVAFPVSRFSNTFIKLGGFQVSVDGVKPPLVLRSAVSLRGMRFSAVDYTIQGEMTGRFDPGLLSRPFLPVGVKAPAGFKEHEWDLPKYAVPPPGLDPEEGWEGLMLKDRSVYPLAFAWVQSIAPGAHQVVRVSYSADLHVQPMRYEMRNYWSYRQDPRAFVIPYDKLKNLPEGDYYFFDYVLRSGATWEGNIGRESITLTAGEGLPLERLKVIGVSGRLTGKNWTWELREAKPTDDVLVALPTN